jgi:hemerythrin-like domain-containing protein
MIATCRFPQWQQSSIINRKLAMYKESLMPIVIGQKPESDFRNPLGLLSDCHRRIERFLDGLIAISEAANGGKLSEELSREFEVGLRYFREAAPKHTLDEEESLFPRLREKEGDEHQATFALLDSLHAEHEEADLMHQQVDELGRAWLANNGLSPENSQMLINLLKDLRATYEKHIALEDNELFPRAGRVLDRSELEAIAQEMAARRGLYTSGVTHEQLR